MHNSVVPYTVYRVHFTTYCGCMLWSIGLSDRCIGQCVSRLRHDVFSCLPIGVDLYIEYIDRYCILLYIKHCISMHTYIHNITHTWDV